MANNPSPTVRRKRLGMELRRLREQAGFTLAQVGEKLECSEARISRLETGHVGVRPGDVMELLEIYQVDDPHIREALVTFARESRRKGWWHSYNDVMPSWFEPYVGFEAAASAIWTYESHLMPGLLQTPEYARALEYAAPRPDSDEEIERRVALRTARQDVFSRENPPDMWVILSEAVLRLSVAEPEVMRKQLHQLLVLAKMPYLTLQVLPFASKAHVNPLGSFKVMEFSDPLDPKLVYLEHLTSSLFLEKEAEVRRYTLVFDHLRAEALSTGESQKLIRQVAEDL